jgi:hypothetical protein
MCVHFTFVTCVVHIIVLFMLAPHISWLSWNATSFQSMSHFRNKWQPPVKTWKVLANGFSLELIWNNTLLGNGFSLDLTWNNTLWNVHKFNTTKYVYVSTKKFHVFFHTFHHSYDILGARMLWKPKEARILKNFIDQPV